MAKQSATDVALISTSANLPETYTSEFDSFAGVGTENITTSDMLIPRLSIIQALSPQLKRGKPEYIEGCEVGHIVDVGTGDLFPGGVNFLPVYYRKDYLEWAPRATGKGLIKIHPDDSILTQTTRDEKGRLYLPNGNLISETAQWYGLNMSANRRKCYVPMAASQLKKSRKWMTMITSERITRPDGSDYQAPIFFRTYDLTTAEESNAEGEWGAWVINRAASLPELGANWKSLLAEAVNFRQALIDGEARADHSQSDSIDVTVEGGAM